MLSGRFSFRLFASCKARSQDCCTRRWTVAGLLHSPLDCCRTVAVVAGLRRDGYMAVRNVAGLLHSSLDCCSTAAVQKFPLGTTFFIFPCIPHTGFRRFWLDFSVYPPTQLRSCLAIFCILSRLFFSPIFLFFACIPPHGFESIATREAGVFHLAYSQAVVSSKARANCRKWPAKIAEKSQNPTVGREAHLWDFPGIFSRPKP